MKELSYTVAKTVTAKDIYHKTLDRCQEAAKQHGYKIVDFRPGRPGEMYLNSVTLSLMTTEQDFHPTGVNDARLIVEPLTQTVCKFVLTGEFRKIMPGEWYCRREPHTNKVIYFMLWMDKTESMCIYEVAVLTTTEEPLA